jgi:thiol-disulfide isomerase/thioredoxin
MKIAQFLFLVIFILHSCKDFSNNEIKVLLNERTIVDTNGTALHPFHHSIPSYIVLPELPGKEIYYADIQQRLFGKRISYLVVKELNHDLLYIDLNGDSILTNDGGPEMFPYDQDSHSFTIYDAHDSLKTIELVFQRKPTGNSPLKKFDDLPEPVVIYYQRKFPEFTGKKGTYFYLNGKVLSRGILTINSTMYDIGLLETTGNGLFNDVSGGSVFGGDLLLIDLNHDKKLSFENEGETFNLGEVFRIGEKNYQLKDIDKYGRFISLAETEENVTKKFLQHMEHLDGRSKRESSFEINSEFWNEIFKTIDSQEIDMQLLKGKYILLNFWGEWCVPCLKELPELKHIEEEFKSKNFEIISFLKSNNMEKARKILKDNKINWPQILYSEKYQKYFNITAFPTNIFINSNGEITKRIGVINRTFIEKYLK